MCSSVRRGEDEANQRHAVFIFATQRGAPGQIPAEKHSPPLQIRAWIRARATQRTHTHTYNRLQQGQKANMSVVPLSHASVRREHRLSYPTGQVVCVLADMIYTSTHVRVKQNRLFVSGWVIIQAHTLSSAFKWHYNRSYGTLVLSYRPHLHVLALCWLAPAKWTRMWLFCIV